MADETPTDDEGFPLEALEEADREPTLDYLRSFMNKVAEEQVQTKVVFKEVEVSKLNLKENDVLVVKMQGEDFEADMLRGLQAHIRKVFPNNKVLVFSLQGDMKMELEVIQAALQSESLSCPPTGYCEGCDCGKREAAEAAAEPVKPPGPYRIPAGSKVKVIDQDSAVFNESGIVKQHIAGDNYLVNFMSVGVIKVQGIAMQEIK
jgi:hypothetical protein